MYAFKYIIFLVVLSLVPVTVLNAAESLDYGSILHLGCDEIPDCIRLLLEAVVRVALPIAVIFIIYSGFLFVTAQGSEQKISEAKSTITWTLIGLAVVVGAWALAVAFQDFFSHL
mgnify:CR=1 FL=1